MTTQLDELRKQFDDATEQSRRLAGRVSDEVFRKRPRPETWSAAECVQHLNLTSAAFLPLFDRALSEAEALPRFSGRYRRDLPGWGLSTMLEPPHKQRFKTPPPFVPGSAQGRDTVTGEFVRLQEELKARLARGSGLALTRVKMVSPFNAKLRYSIYSAFCITTAHERRHLWQAEHALTASP